MTPEAIIAALGIPAAARVDRPVAKKLLVEKGARTAADRRQLNEAVEKLRWVAALKPAQIGVPEFRDDEREYLEIHVLLLDLRFGHRGGRLTELVHRAIPYPVVLLCAAESGCELSLAHKRNSLGEAGKIVVDGEVLSTGFDPGEADSGCVGAFLDALQIGRLPGRSLSALYQGWMDTVVALQISRITGTFSVLSSAKQAAARREAFRECGRIQAKIAALRPAAASEKQLARQVELDLEIKRLEAALNAARAKL